MKPVASTAGVTLSLTYGGWGVLAAVAVMMFAYLTELTRLVEVVWGHLDRRWLLGDDKRTNRQIALDISLPVSTTAARPLPPKRPQPGPGR